jgi:hypothetical protein
MAFGAYTGRSGGVGQRPYGLSAMFLGLSQGLSEFAKMSAGEDARKATQQHDDARQAAEQAFQQNMARFSQEHQDKREDTRQAGENARAADTAKVNSTHWDQEHADKQAADARMGKYQDAEIGIRQAAEKNAAAREKNLEGDRDAQTKLREAQAGKAQNEIESGNAKVAISTIEESLKTPRLAVEDARKRLDAMKSTGTDDQLTAAQKDYDAAKGALSKAEDSFTPLRDKAMKALGYSKPDPSLTSDEFAPGKPGAKDLVGDAEDALSGRSKAGMQPSGGASDPLSTLSPDRQAWARRAMQVEGKSAADAAAEAAKQSDAVIQRGNSMPPAKATTSQAQSPDGSFIPPDSTQAAAPAITQAPAATDQTAAPQPPSVAEATPPPGPMTANANEAQGLPAQTGTTADDKSAQFQQIAQQLGQSPEGQGVQATLDRLAEAKDGPVADKMRRAAQIQLEQNFGVDSDTSSGFIDYSLDQNAQQSEIA